MSVKQDAKTDVALAYIGNVIPEEIAPCLGNFSRAANMWQNNLLCALRDAGLPPSLILSQLPMRAFPNSPQIWHRRSRVVLPSGLSIDLVPFLNLAVLRPFTVGLAILCTLVLWAWRHSGIKHKVVFTYNLTEPPGLFTLFAARLIGATAVASMNDVNVPGETVPANLFYRLDFCLHKRLIRRFDALVVVNARTIRDFAPGVPFIRVQGGVAAEVFQYFQKNRDKEPDGCFTIVSTGSLNEINGFADLLEAFALLKGNRYRLCIAGSGHLENKIRQSAEKDPRIEYCGYLEFKDVLALYEKADVLINMRLTKRINTGYYFPSKMMEYLASGVPVISTCTGNVEDEFGDLVFLLKEETPRALARAIESLASMDPKVRLQKGRAARDYMQAHYTWPAQGRRVAELIYGNLR